MPLMNTFTFLTFTRPLAIPSDVSAVLLKHSFAFVSHFIAEEGYSILTETSTQSFLVSDNNFLFLIIIMPDYNYSIFKGISILRRLPISYYYSSILRNKPSGVTKLRSEEGSLSDAIGRNENKKMPSPFYPLTISSHNYFAKQGV